MCPCHPEDNQITLALLAAVGILLAVTVLRRFWPAMNGGLRMLTVGGIVLLTGAGFTFYRGNEHPTACPHHPAAASTREEGIAPRCCAVATVSIPPAPAEKEGAVQPSGPGVIAYYFHRTVRCPSCLMIEELSRQAIETGFVPALADGQLAWRVIDIEQAGNKHFVEDFDLTEPSLVLVHKQPGQPAVWKILDATWDHLDDPAALQRYVQTELERFMYAEMP
ncbi:MAG: hypothetical protein GXY44_16795 [Phycisphaerales bacterium]|nr:hypothetical protein [Phycisphaerales bacterium]